MSFLSKASWLAKYNDATEGLYKAGQIGGIGSDDHRSLVQDLEDSVLWLEDFADNFYVSALAPTDSNEYLLNYGSGIEISDYTDQVLMFVEFNQTNTGPATLKYGDLDAVPVYKKGSATYIPVQAGDIHPGDGFWVYFDSEHFRILGAIGVSDSESETDISSADILTANATPIDLAQAPGAGKVNIPIYFVISMEYNSAPYDTNLEFAFQYEDGTQIYVDSAPYLLESTEDKVRMVQVPIIDGVINSKIQFTVNGGDPLTGDSDIKITTKYKTITI